MSSRLRERLARPLRATSRWSLRTRLVVSVVGLLAAASLIIGTVSIFVLQGFLIDRLDAQLDATTGRSQQAVTEAPQPGTDTPGFLTLPGLRPDTLGAIVGNGTAIAGVLDANGRLHVLSGQQVSRLLDVPADGKPVTIDLGGNLGDYRVAANQVRPGVFLITGLPLSDVQTTLWQLAGVIGIVTLVGVALAALGGTAIVRLALRPLERMVDTASGVAELPLEKGEVALAVRVSASTPTPAPRSAASARRSTACSGTSRPRSPRASTARSKVRQFVADASHELRTPLTSIRGYAELTRRSGR